MCARGCTEQNIASCKRSGKSRGPQLLVLLSPQVMRRVARVLPLPNGQMLAMLPNGLGSEVEVVLLSLPFDCMQESYRSCFHRSLVWLPPSVFYLVMYVSCFFSGPYPWML